MAANGPPGRRGGAKETPGGGIRRKGAGVVGGEMGAAGLRRAGKNAPESAPLLARSPPPSRSAEVAARTMPSICRSVASVGYWERGGGGGGLSFIRDNPPAPVASLRALGPLEPIELRVVAAARRASPAPSPRSAAAAALAPPRRRAGGGRGTPRGSNARTLRGGGRGLSSSPRPRGSNALVAVDALQPAEAARGQPARAVRSGSAPSAGPWPRRSQNQRAVRSASRPRNTRCAGASRASMSTTPRSRSSSSPASTSAAASARCGTTS